MAEAKVLDGVIPPAVTGKKKNSAKKQKTEHGKKRVIVSFFVARGLG